MSNNNQSTHTENESANDELFQYRPEFTWLEETFTQVKRTFDLGKLPQALLMIGPVGSGKSILSSYICQSILCAETREHLSPACGCCKSCLLIQSNSHPDFTKIDRLYDKNGKRKQSISIDQIRELTNKLRETPQLAGWRCVTILSVERMTTSAFNALLKTLEEPGPRTLIILLASGIQQVPATIKSRCQHLTLKLTEAEITPWLTQTANCNPDTAKKALQQCQLAPFLALNHIKNGTSKVCDEIFEGLDGILTNEIAPADFLSQYSELDDQLWIEIANYFKKVQLCVLESNQDIYKNLPRPSAVEFYQLVLAFNRAQCEGVRLQTELQLEAILIQWFELGRKIVHYSN